MISSRWNGCTTLVCYLAIVIGLGCCQTVYADGKVYPGKAYKVPPSIPHQTALISFRNGLETLVVQSNFKGPGEEFGWIVPVPAVPTNLEAVSPGFLKTLNTALGPSITANTHASHPSALALLCLVLLWSCVSLLSKSKSNRRVLHLFLLIVGVGAIVIGILMPALSRTRQLAGSSIVIEGTHIHAQQRVDQYDVTVIEADTAEALNQWLSANQYMELEAQDRGVVDQYIQEQWVFVAARLHHEGEGIAYPHPLSITFVTKAPIYPMRLTGTLESAVYVDLFVVSDSAQICEPLEVEVRDRLTFQENVPTRYDETLSGFVGDHFSHRLGHPLANRYFWDGCVVSRLCGIVAPDDMQQDFKPLQTQFNPLQKHYYSFSAAQNRSVGFGVGGLILSLIVGTFAIRSRLPQDQIVGLNTVLKLFVVSLMIAVGVGGACYLSVSKTETETIGLRKAMMKLHHARYLEHVGLIVASEQGHFEGYNVDQIDVAIQLFLQEYNPSVKFQREDSPGNYTLELSDHGVILKLYDEEGFYQTFMLTDHQGTL